jgi:hypothetical protein
MFFQGDNPKYGKEGIGVVNMPRKYSCRRVVNWLKEFNLVE